MEFPEHPPFIGEKEFLDTHSEVKRTEEEILKLIAEQEAEEVKKETLGFSISEFETLLKLEILDEARKLKIVQNYNGPCNTVEDKLNLLKKQKFAVWFFWDGLNTVRVERGLIVNIYVHTSAKDIINNKDIWKMLRDVLSRCHSKEGGLVEGTELELRSKMQQWYIMPELRRMKRQVIDIGDREEEFDLLPKHRILTKEGEIYTVTMKDRITGITATGKGDIKYRNQIDWGTKLELSRKVREFEWNNRSQNEV